MLLDLLLAITCFIDMNVYQLIKLLISQNHSILWKSTIQIHDIDKIRSLLLFQSMVTGRYGTLGTRVPSRAVADPRGGTARARTRHHNMAATTAWDMPQRHRTAIIIHVQVRKTIVVMTTNILQYEKETYEKVDFKTLF